MMSTDISQILGYYVTARDMFTQNQVMQDTVYIEDIGELSQMMS